MGRWACRRTSPLSTGNSLVHRGDQNVQVNLDFNLIHVELPRRLAGASHPSLVVAAGRMRKPPVERTEGLGGGRGPGSRGGRRTSTAAGPGPEGKPGASRAVLELRRL